MKQKTVIIAITYFMLINAAAWIRIEGFLPFFVAMVLMCIYPILLLVLVYNILSFINKKLDKSRSAKIDNRKYMLKTGILSIVLMLAYLFPNGVLPRSTFEKPSIFYAYYEGVANCTTSLKLFADHRFEQASVCFAIVYERGNYIIEGDTIQLLFDKEEGKEQKSGYAVITRDTIHSKKPYHTLAYYTTESDKELPMVITKMEF